MTTQSRSRIPDRVRWAVEQLELQPTDRVLEIGSGPGLAIALVAEQLPRGNITAIDRSVLQVKKARTLNRDLIDAGKAQIEQVSVEQAPEVLGEGAYAKILAINVNAFWTTPGPSLASLRRLLAGKGRVYLVYEPPGAARLGELERTLPALLRQAGFTAVKCHRAPKPLERLLCVRATQYRATQ